MQFLKVVRNRDFFFSVWASTSLWGTSLVNRESMRPGVAGFSLTDN